MVKVSRLTSILCEVEFILNTMHYQRKRRIQGTKNNNNTFLVIFYFGIPQLIKQNIMPSTGFPNHFP